MHRKGERFGRVSGAQIGERQLRGRQVEIVRQDGRGGQADKAARNNSSGHAVRNTSRICGASRRVYQLQILQLHRQSHRSETSRSKTGS